MTTTNKKLKNLTPAYLIHPSEFLVDELKSRKISQAEFAKTIDMSRTQLNEILKGKRTFNVEFCLLIAKALKMKDQIWLNLFHQYEIDAAKINVRDKLEAIEFENWKKENTNPKYLKKHGFLTNSKTESIENIRNLYDLAFLSQENSIINEPRYAMYRKSQKLSSNPINIITWEKVVMHIAKQNKVAIFNPDNTSKLIAKLKVVFTNNQDVLKQSKVVLSEYGIKLVIQESPEKCNIDGVTFWSNDNPAIGLPMRYKKLDIFAFTLLHEIGHVYLHLVKNKEAKFTDILQDDHGYGISKEEKEANEFARTSLISNANWDDFQLRNFKPNDNDFILFAQEQKIHPSIVFGRHCFEHNKWKKRTKIQRQIG